MQTHLPVNKKANCHTSDSSFDKLCHASFSQTMIQRDRFYMGLQHKCRYIFQWNIPSLKIIERIKKNGIRLMIFFNICAGRL